MCLVPRLHQETPKQNECNQLSCNNALPLARGRSNQGRLTDARVLNLNLRFPDDAFISALTITLLKIHINIIKNTINHHNTRDGFKTGDVAQT